MMARRRTCLGTRCAGYAYCSHDTPQIVTCTSLSLWVVLVEFEFELHVTFLWHGTFHHAYHEESVLCEQGFLSVSMVGKMF